MRDDEFVAGDAKNRPPNPCRALARLDFAGGGSSQRGSESLAGEGALRSKPSAATWRFTTRATVIQSPEMYKQLIRRE
jgi:hypothetical protein